MQDFTFKVYARRWNGDVTYRLNKTDTGWHVHYIAAKGDSAPDGKPFLQSALHQDSITYPKQISQFLEFVWEKLHRTDFEPEEAQSKLQEVADWISACEKSQPVWSALAR